MGGHIFVEIIGDNVIESYDLIVNKTYVTFNFTISEPTKEIIVEVYGSPCQFTGLLARAVVKVKQPSLILDLNVKGSSLNLFLPNLQMTYQRGTY